MFDCAGYILRKVVGEVVVVATGASGCLRREFFCIFREGEAGELFAGALATRHREDDINPESWIGYDFDHDEKRNGHIHTHTHTLRRELQ